MKNKVGFCYAVLIDNGSCKIGRTSDAFGRICSHVISAEGFGLTVERVYLSEQVEDCHEIERKFFERLGISQWHGEYCSDMSTRKIEKLFADCGVKYYSGVSIHKGLRRGEILFSEFPYTVSGNQRGPDANKTSINDRVADYIERLQPVRRGVLINRVRSFDARDVASTIDSLLLSGDIKEITLPSKKEGRTLKRYVMSDFDINSPTL